MDKEQAEFFYSTILPIIRDCAERECAPTQEDNPLRAILRQTVEYVDYLVARERDEKPEVPR